jgi:transcriptional regulator with XRE-family HTH domain
MKSIYLPTYRALLVWLREQRRAQGISMRDLAVKLDVPHSWVGKIETGERRLDVAEFVRLCEALEIDPHVGVRLLRRENAAYPLPKPRAYAQAAEKRL